MLSYDELLIRAKSLPGQPVAIEAFWDGDTTGWFLVLTALFVENQDRQSKYKDINIAILSEDGGDIRLFTRQVPPWPEAELAQQAGQEIANQLGVPFYFPSPNHPEDACPRWWEQDKGVPCDNCGVPLLTRGSHSDSNLCHHCWVASLRSK